MHQRHQIAVQELHRRQVHSDLQRLRPGRGFPARGAQDPLAHLDDQAAFLGERNEHARRDDTAGRMIPAHQRLEADHSLPIFACG